MRAAIKLFKNALPERARHLRDEMKWVATVLGDVRDVDVQLERLEEGSARVDDDGYRDTLRRTSRLLEKQRKEARGRGCRPDRPATSLRGFLRGMRKLVHSQLPHDPRRKDPPRRAGRRRGARPAATPLSKWRKCGRIDDASAPENTTSCARRKPALRP